MKDLCDVGIALGNNVNINSKNNSKNNNQHNSEKNNEKNRNQLNIKESSKSLSNSTAKSNCQLNCITIQGSGDGRDIYRCFGKNIVDAKSAIEQQCISLFGNDTIDKIDLFMDQYSTPILKIHIVKDNFEHFKLAFVKHLQYTRFYVPFLNLLIKYKYHNRFYKKHVTFDFNSRQLAKQLNLKTPSKIRPPRVGKTLLVNQFSGNNNENDNDKKTESANGQSIDNERGTSPCAPPIHPTNINLHLTYNIVEFFFCLSGPA